MCETINHPRSRTRQPCSANWWRRLPELSRSKREALDFSLFSAGNRYCEAQFCEGGASPVFQIAEVTPQVT